MAYQRIFTETVGTTLVWSVMCVSATAHAVSVERSAFLEDWTDVVGLIGIRSVGVVAVFLLRHCERKGAEEGEQLEHDKF
jgi:hypothetical protein